MKCVRNLAFVTLSTAFTFAAAPSFAAEAGPWKDLCKLDLGTGDFGEEGHLLYQEREDPVQGIISRGGLIYNAAGAVNLVEYPTDAKALMSAYSGPKMWIGIYGEVTYDTAVAEDFSMGYFGVTATARDFSRIPGEVTVQLEIDGKVFGPYTPDPSRAEGGNYALWFDTVETDADRLPPIVDATAFKAVTDAVAKMEQGAFVLLRDGKSIVRMPLPRPRYQNWLTGLPGFAERSAIYYEDYRSCPAGSEDLTIDE
jgi:hypothetical protein